MKENLNGKGPVSESLNHLSANSLEQIAEGTLPSADAEKAKIHLGSCGRCKRELASYENLFERLSELPRFAPSPVFADAVMARVRLTPQESAVMIWLKRWVPSSRRGWIVLGTLVTAPATPIMALIAWMLVQPLVTPSALWQWSLLRAQTGSQTAIAWLSEQTLSIGSWDIVAVIYSELQGVPPAVIGAALTLVSVAIPLSAWGLVKLIRTPGVNVTYAN